jgi:hypothetical protein
MWVSLASSASPPSLSSSQSVSVSTSLNETHRHHIEPSPPPPPQQQLPSQEKTLPQFGLKFESQMQFTSKVTTSF